MVQPAQEKFDLLPLLWRQNPWIWVLCLMLLLVALAALVLWWLRRNRPLVVSPHNVLVASLEKISLLPVDTHVAQLQFYERLMGILKEYVHHERQCKCVVACGSLTDQECFSLLERSNDAQFLASIAEIEKLSQLVRFNQNVAVPEDIFLHTKEILAMMRRR